MRFFLPLRLVFFLTGALYYGYACYTMHRFTHMSAMLLIYQLSLFLLGLISEQISALHYKELKTISAESGGIRVDFWLHGSPVRAAGAVIRREAGGASMNLDRWR